MLLLLLLLAHTASAGAHEFALQVACDNGAAPRLVASLSTRGPRACALLLPGDDQFLGRFIHDQPRVATLRADAPSGVLCRLPAAHLVGIRRVRADAGLSFFEPSSFRPVLANDGDLFEFFHDERGDFDFQLLTAADRPGRFSAALQFVDRSGMLPDSEPVELCFETALAEPAVRYACPMRCEGERTYDRPGRCPVCRMALADPAAHQDHRPRHGGTFFMAPDGVHHLEGVATGQGEFRVYFYDEYTRPVGAGQFAARGSAWTPGSADPQRLALVPARGDEYQAAPIAVASGEVRVRLWVDFADGSGPQPFDFDFQMPPR
ncbi:MAG: heavy metal-binding domain-containing protein [Phycisphaerae bacterium]